MLFFAFAEVLVGFAQKRAKKAKFILEIWPFWGLPISIRSDFDRFRLDFVGFDENLMAWYEPHENLKKR